MPRRGPATPAGKAAASRNAWKHGILASAMIIPKFHQTLVTPQSYCMGQLTDVASSPEALKRFFTKGDVPPPVEGADDAEEIPARLIPTRSEEHTSELQSQSNL